MPNVIYSYAAIAATTGLIVGLLLFYLLAYRKLKRNYYEKQDQFTQLQIDSSAVEKKLVQEHNQATDAWNQERESLRSGIAVLKEKLEQTGLELNALERAHSQLKARMEKLQQFSDHEIKRLQAMVEQLAKEKNLSETSLKHELAKLKRDHQTLEHEKSRLNAWLERIQKEKAQADANLEEQQQTWEQERLDYQVQIQHLEKERSALENKLTGLNATGALAVDGIGETTDLRSQIEQLQSDNNRLENKLTAQETQAKQEQQALEEEIELLLERITHLQENAAR